MPTKTITMNDMHKSIYQLSKKYNFSEKEACKHLGLPVEVNNKPLVKPKTTKPKTKNQSTQPPPKPRGRPPKCAKKC